MVTPRRTARRHSAVGCTPQEPPITLIGVPGLRTVETGLASVSRKLRVSSQTRTWRGHGPAGTRQAPALRPGPGGPGALFALGWLLLPRVGSPSCGISYPPPPNLQEHRRWPQHTGASTCPRLNWWAQGPSRGVPLLVPAASVAPGHRRLGQAWMKAHTPPKRVPHRSGLAGNVRDRPDTR